MARSGGTLHKVARLNAFREFDHFTAIRAADDGHRQISRSRFKRPRSKPTTASLPTVITGTAILPVFAINSARATLSSATFFAVNSIP